MKINTFSQNKLSFGIRKPFNDELKIDTLKQRIRSNVDLPPNTTRVHDLLFERILSAKGNQSLRCLFNQVKNGKGSNELKEALKKCKDNLKRIFWETCDRFFDVQLTKPGDKSRDDAERHIPDDYELTAIFPTERASHIDSRKDAIKFIDYYCSCYIEAKQKGEKLNKGKMFDSFLETRSNKVLKGTLLQYKTAIYNIYAHLDKIYKFTSLREFQEYILNKCNGENYTICRNETLFSHAFRKLKELKQKEAEIEIVSYEDVNTTNNTKKFIDHYCSCYIEAKQKGEKLNKGKMFDSFLETRSNKVLKGTLMQYKIAINKIKNHLDESIGKTVEEFRQYIMNECNGKLYTICKNKELFSYAVDKLIELEKEMAEKESAPVPQEFVQPLPFNMVPQYVNYYPANQPPLNYVRPNWENLEINYVPQNIQTETNATGEIERDPYEVTLNNQWNEDGNFNSFKSSGDNDQELLDLLCPQSSDADDLGLTGDDLFDSLVLEGDGVFSDRFPQQSFKDLGLSGDDLVDLRILEEHGMFSDRFNLPKLEDFKFGLNSSQLPDTNSFANDNKLNLSRPHESYDDAYSDKRRKM